MLLKLEDYFPTNREYLKEEWDKVMNIPNSYWESNNIDKEIRIINDEEYLYTLRTFKLNTLLNLIIRILDNQK